MILKFVMSHVVEKVEYMKQKAIHAPSYRKDMVGEALVDFDQRIVFKGRRIKCI